MHDLVRRVQIVVVEEFTSNEGKVSENETHQSWLMQVAESDWQLCTRLVLIGLHKVCSVVGGSCFKMWIYFCNNTVQKLCCGMDYCENVSRFQNFSYTWNNAKLNLFNKRPVVTIIRDWNGRLFVHSFFTAVSLCSMIGYCRITN